MLTNGTTVYLKGDKDAARGEIAGRLDEMYRVKWEDGTRGIYWYDQLDTRSPYDTPRCPICAGLNCKSPHD